MILESYSQRLNQAELSLSVDAPYAPGNRGLWRKAKALRLGFASQLSAINRPAGVTQKSRISQGHEGAWGEGTRGASRPSALAFHSVARIWKKPMLSDDTLAQIADNLARIGLAPADAWRPRS